MACIDAESAFFGSFCSFDERRNCRFAVCAEHVSVWLCVQFYPVASAQCCSFGHFGISADENGCSDSVILEFPADFGEEASVAERVPAGVRSNRILSIGNQGDLVGLDLQDKINERWDWVTFYVELCGYQRFDFSDVRISDVSFIRPGMNCDAFGAEPLTINRRLGYIWHVSPACVPDCGDFVDVDTESCHMHSYLYKRQI